MKLKLLLAFLLYTACLHAQSSAVPLHSQSAHDYERLSIQSGAETPVHPAIQPLWRKDLAEFAQKQLETGTGNKRDIQYLLADNNAWTDSAHASHKPLLKHFFQKPANFFEVNTPSFTLRANPLLRFDLGKEQQSGDLLFVNQRGVELYGSIDDRVYFYTNVLESQIQAPQYVRLFSESNKAVPGVGFYKNYKSDFFKVDKGYDFNTANAYLGVQASKHISVELGHGQHFIGNGYRSLLLSDFGAYYFYLKFSTRVWKLHYQNLFMELSPVSQRAFGGNQLLPKKYAAIHYLSYQPIPALSLGFFEATVFNRQDHFELQYLNPLILYRSVEGLIGSPDNVLIGFDGRLNLAHRFQIYGQLLIDEFLLSAVLKPEQTGWWGNKFGLQAGLKYIDVLGIRHLDLQLEFNAVRPYTYAHFDSLSSYTHYNQALAHPLGANFQEYIGILRYQPIRPLSLSARVLHIEHGENSNTENWGANPLLPYGTRLMDYGNTLGQGVGASTNLLGLDASWELYHNLFLDLHLLVRQKNSANDALDLNSTLFSAGVRMNVWPQNYDF